MKNKFQVFILAFAVWSLMTWPFERGPGGLELDAIAIGLVVSLIVALIFGKGFSGTPGHMLQPRRWLYAAGFILVFAYYCLKANLQVAFMVAHPALPIKPGIVRIRTSLKSRAAIAMLANCITLTPGTLTVEATEDGVLYVHWLTVSTTDEDEAGRLIAGKFEPFLARIFEDGK